MLNTSLVKQPRRAKHCHCTVMRSFFLVTILLFVSVIAVSQTGRKGLLKGVLKDSAVHMPLEAATVSLIYLKDSSSGGMALTKKNGSFLIEDLSFGSYDCYISIAGYTPLVKTITVKADSRMVDLDTIFLPRQTKQLDDIIIQSVPVKVKEDTLEYNAASFKPAPNARLEELLKRLPGLKVERDGSLSFNGEPITQIMVDGKPFFLDDPKVAAKNLPADIVDKVQVIDQRSKENEIRKINDDNTQKVLNLTLKKDKKKGVMGNITAGNGNNNRYTTQANLNFINGERKISILGGANNVNNAGFSGTGIFVGGRGAGISETRSMGINYKDALNKKKTLTAAASYFYGKSDNISEQSSFRQNLLLDSSFFNQRNSTSRQKNFNHRINADIEFKPDTLNYLHMSANISINHSSGNSFNQSNITDDDSAAINSSVQDYTNTGKGYNVGANINYVKSFHTKGQFLSVTVSLNNSFNRSENFSHSVIDYFKTAIIDTIRRRTMSDNGVTSYNINFSYAHPLGKGYFIETNFNRNENVNFSDRLTYDFNTTTREFDLLNTGLSSHTHNINITYNYGGGIRSNQKKYNWYAGLSIQQMEIINRSEIRDSLIEASMPFKNYRPTASFNYNFSKTKRININYNGYTRQPTIQQLSPIVDSSNRLFIRYGNPDLKPEFTHRLSANYSNRDMTKWALSVSGAYSYTLNRIATLNIFDTNGVQSSKPVNVNGSFASNGRISLNIPIRNKQFNASFFVSPTYNRDVNFINGERNHTITKSVSNGITFSFRDKKTFDIYLSLASSYSALTYSVQPNLNTELLGFDADANIEISLPANWRLQLNMDYNQNTFAARRFNRGVALLNAGISKQFFKSKQLELRLSGFDLLKQNQSYFRTSSENYIEDVRNLVLSQYFLLSLNYNINRFGAKRK